MPKVWVWEVAEAGQAGEGAVPQSYLESVLSGHLFEPGGGEEKGGGWREGRRVEGGKERQREGRMEEGELLVISSTNTHHSISCSSVSFINFNHNPLYNTLTHHLPPTILLVCPSTQLLVPPQL